MANGSVSSETGWDANRAEADAERRLRVAGQRPAPGRSRVRAPGPRNARYGTGSRFLVTRRTSHLQAGGAIDVVSLLRSVSDSVRPRVEADHPVASNRLATRRRELCSQRKEVLVVRKIVFVVVGLAGAMSTSCTTESPRSEPVGQPIRASLAVSAAARSVLDLARQATRPAIAARPPGRLVPHPSARVESAAGGIAPA